MFALADVGALPFGPGRAFQTDAPLSQAGSRTDMATTPMPIQTTSQESSLPLPLSPEKLLPLLPSLATVRCRPMACKPQLRPATSLSASGTGFRLDGVGKSISSTDTGLRLGGRAWQMLQLFHHCRGASVTKRALGDAPYEGAYGASAMIEPGWIPTSSLAL